MRIYIAGPMDGYEKNNFPAFDAAASFLRLSGWNIVNPADIGRREGWCKHDGTPLSDGRIQPSPRTYMLEDLKALATCDAIYLLKGWENSKGARAEHAVAVAMRLPLYYQIGV